MGWVPQETLCDRDLNRECFLVKALSSNPCEESRLGNIEFQWSQQRSLSQGGLELGQPSVSTPHWGKVAEHLFTLTSIQLYMWAAFGEWVWLWEWSSFPLIWISRRHSGLSCQPSTLHTQSDSQAHSTYQEDEVLESSFQVPVEQASPPEEEVCVWLVKTCRSKCPGGCYSVIVTGEKSDIVSMSPLCSLSPYTGMPWKVYSLLPVYHVIMQAHYKSWFIPFSHYLPFMHAYDCPWSSHQEKDKKLGYTDRLLAAFSFQYCDSIHICMLTVFLSCLQPVEMRKRS